MNNSVFNNYVVRVEESGHEWEMVSYAVVVTDEIPNTDGVLESMTDDTGETIVVEDYATEGAAYDAMLELEMMV